MITVEVGGTRLQIVPKRLHDYIRKVEFIKSRRSTPWNLLRDVPRSLPVADWTAFVETAMRTAHQCSSSVTPAEEHAFDTSEEGLFYNLFVAIEMGRGRKPERSRLLQSDSRKPEDALPDWHKGINEARRLWEQATSEERAELTAALFATDQIRAIKKSDGPSESEENAKKPGDQEAPKPSP